MSVKQKALLLALGFSSLSHAGSFVPACTPGNVTVPCTRGAWGLGIDGLYFRSEENALSLNSAYRASYGLGFRVEGGYHWGTGSDINLNWAHYKKTTNNLIVGNLRSEFDIVNAEFGQHVDLGEHVDIRLHSGLQFAGLDSDEITIAIPAIPPGEDPPTPGVPAVPSVTNAWRAQAWGPRIGIDSAYNCGNGFAVFANAAVSVQAQKMKQNLAGVAAVFYGTGIANDAKLGVRYTHPMAQGDLTLRAAWEVHNYTNAGSNQATAGPDLGWSGLSFGLKWVANA